MSTIIFAALLRRAKYCLPASMLFSLQAPVNAQTPSFDLVCPPSVPAASLRVVDTPPGWTSQVERPLYLHSAAPIDGPPQRRGVLATYTVKQQHGQARYTYRLVGAFPEGKWLQCAYGEHGQVTLSRQLDDAIRECRFTYDKGPKAGQQVIHIDCK